MPVESIYERLCPSCGKWGEASFITKFGMCSRCISRLNKNHNLNAIQYIEEIESDVKEFEEFFRRATGGYTLWGSQRIWVKRLLKKENTSIIAPTGIGKTTLLTVYALYSAIMYKEKILILSPTTSLAKQTYMRLKAMCDNINANLRIVFYDSRLSRNKKNEIITMIKNGEYDILVVTNAFLSRHSSLFKGKHFDIIIADDVDSILNRSRNILRILNMLGYTDESIELAKKIVNLRSKILLAKINGLEEAYQKYLRDYLELETKLYKVLKTTKKGQLVIASATGRARGPFIPVMRELLALDITGITLYARDVTDCYKLVKSAKEVYDFIVEIVSRIGSGGIILLSPYHPLKKTINIEELIKYLSEKGYKISKASPSSIQKLINGEIDLIIGSSSYYGVGVRGIDSPEKIKYVIFIGTPVFVTDLKNLLYNPKTLYRLLLHLKEKGYDVLQDITILSKILRYTSSNELRLLKDLLRERIPIEDINNDKIREKYEKIKEIAERAYDTYKKLLDQEIKQRIGTIVIYKINKKYIALMPDAMTYIQASGRTSRLYHGVMTHGLSIIIEDQSLEELIDAMNTKIKYINRSSGLKSFDTIDIDYEKNIIEKSRVKSNRSANIAFKTVLLVVESPTKARTIANFFGKPARRKLGSVTVYETPIVKDNNITYLNIVATKGHLYDLSTNTGNTFGMNIDYVNGQNITLFYKTIKRCRVCGHQFTDGDVCPRCGSSYYSDSIEVINVLRKLASEVDEILIGTDPDTEGEKIAYDIFLTVKPFNDNVYRVEFHEITLRELEKALKNKRAIDYNLVNAQIFRRVLDRLIGFSLSQELWRVYEKHWLGAGRVQTPVLGWVIDYYNEYLRNKCYALKIIAGTKEPYLQIQYCSESKEEIEDIINSIKKNNTISIEIVETFTEEVKPSPPYTTDELLYDASRIGIPATLAMKLAQELFESGLITYHRTDSTYVSTYGIELAKKYLSTKYSTNLFAGRHWGNQGTHEAIRPTNPWDSSDIEKYYSEGLLPLPIYLTPLHIKLYDLIFRRFIASQMKPYKQQVAVINVRLSNDKIVTQKLPVKIIERGFNEIIQPKVYTWLLENKRSNITVPVQRLTMYRTSKSPLPTQGTIIKLMKERGIGRPSTYTATLKNLRRHGYIIFSKKRNYIIPTKIGINVYEYLSRRHNDLVSEETTRYMEETIDKIRLGQLSLESAIDNVVSKLVFHNLIHVPGEREKATV
ncbi:reverse gyrase [Desulfurococcaceae archaeon MEX13E-LK6-19]|nr:reverse gyrase [Desulfurococcaceae archaeon MEX13E-LK6-19]